MSQYNATAKPKKNWAVYVLFAFAVIAGILALLDAARYMGWLPVSLTTVFGELSFVVPNAMWFAALMSAIVGIIWFVVAKWIWDQNPSGLLFVMVIAVVNLIFLFMSLLGNTTFSAILTQVVVNAVALVLALLPGTKAAFGNRI